MSKLEEIQEAIASLSPNERNLLSHWVSQHEWSEDEHLVNKEWLEVAKRRSNEIKQGTAKTISSDEAIRELREIHEIDL